VGSPDLPRRLIAGSVGPERIAPRPDPAEARWFEPLHVRAPGPARDRLAALVAAGADVLLAPTWLTHRRALLPVGETRRAREWTAAAVRLAREAAEVGLERRERGAPDPRQAPDRSETPERRGTPDPRQAPDRRGAPDPVEATPATAGAMPAIPRHPVLVAGVLPVLDERPEASPGRLLPTSAAAERDDRAHAGLLSDAGADLLVVEGLADLAGSRLAIGAAVETGLRVWASVAVGGERDPAVASGESLEAWAGAVAHLGVEAVLLDPSSDRVVSAAVEQLRAAGTPTVGVVPCRPTIDPERLATGATRWLDAGAWHLGLADGASPDRIAVLRAALDAADAARLAARAAERERWAGLVRDAARRAPGGQAFWIGAAGETVPPPGFAWTHVPAEAVHSLPARAARLVIAVGPGVELARLATLLDEGGVLLARLADRTAIAALGLRVLDVADDAPGSVVLARRDP
jgi:S-methylmethionine-dependent homocysteine/selenocysteine methylase